MNLLATLTLIVRPKIVGDLLRRHHVDMAHLHCPACACVGQNLMFKFSLCFREGCSTVHLCSANTRPGQRRVTSHLGPEIYSTFFIFNDCQHTQ